MFSLSLCCEPSGWPGRFRIGLHRGHNRKRGDSKSRALIALRSMSAIGALASSSWSRACEGEDAAHLATTRVRRNGIISCVLSKTESIRI